MSDYKINTTYCHPPIPMRDWDYCACFECDTDFGPVGWGETIPEALKDLEITVDLFGFPDSETAARMDAIKEMLAI